MNQPSHAALERRLIPPKEAADRAGVSVRTLQRMVRRGEGVTPVRISRGRVGYYAHEFEAWLSNLPRTQAEGGR